MLSPNVFETVPVVAVSVAVVEAETAAIVAVNPALDDPAGTLTLEGTETLVLLLARPTLNPPLGAAPVRLTVHDTEPGELTVLDEHEIPLSEVELCATEMVPEAPAPAVSEPIVLETTIPPIEIGTCASGALVEIVNVTAARVPLAIGFAFDP